jgi:hypothetical protein
VTRIKRALISSTVILIAGLAAVAYTYVEGYQKNAQLESDSEREKRLFGFGRIHASRIELKNKHGLFVFERGLHKTWRINAPVDWAADHAAVSLLVDHMATIKAEVTVTENADAKQLKDYGLDQPVIHLAATLKSGAQHELLVGKKHEFENGYYITDGKKKRIGIATATFYDILSRDLDSFRARTLFPFRSEFIKSVKVQKQAQALYSLIQDQEAWTVDNAAADSDYIARLLLVLTRDLRAESFETDALDKNDKQKMNAFGLDAPRFRLRLSLTDGRSFEALISAGPEELNGRGPFLHLLGTKTVVTIYENFLHDLDKPAEKFRDRSISRFDRDEVTIVKIQFSDGRKAEVEKVKGSWVLGGPARKAVKPWIIDALIMKFSNLRSDKIVSEHASPEQRAKWQLTQPIHEISFWKSGAQVLAEIQIGKRFDDKQVFISAKHLKRVDSIDSDKLAGFPVSAASLLKD